MTVKMRGQPLDGETQAARRACFVRQDSKVQCSAWDRGECTHLSSFGRTRQGGGGESIREEWEVPVLQSSGLGGI